MSDLTLRLAADLPADSGIIVRPTRTGSTFQLEFGKLHLWSDGHESESAACCAAGAEALSRAAENIQEGSLYSAHHSSSLSLEHLSRNNSRGADHDLSFGVHLVVLCANSAYFRTLITTDVGTPFIGTRMHVCKIMDLAMKADEFDAAASVLYFFYTSQLARVMGGCCDTHLLLQMMKVSVP